VNDELRQDVKSEMKDIQQQLEALRKDLNDAQARAVQTEGQLTELDERRAETADRLQLALRQVDDFRDELDRKESQLEEARREAAIAEVENAVRVRDETAARVAASISSVVDGLEELDDRRDDLARAQSELAGSGLRLQIPGEPPSFEEAMERLVAVVRTKLDETLEDELLDAAARSPRPRAIDELPPHLQEAARNRRRQLAKQRWDG
jgi:chromosome segregation ATPase